MRCDHPLTDRRAMDTEDIDTHLPTNTADADADANAELSRVRYGLVRSWNSTMLVHKLLATAVVNAVTEPAIRLERVVDVDVDVDDLCSHYYYCCCYFPHPS